MTNENIRKGRAKNAMLSYFEHKLYIPKIYMDAIWDNHKVDVLAIDRDGSGDIHVMLILHPPLLEGRVQSVDNAKAEMALVEALQQIHAHFRYIVCVGTRETGRIKEIEESTFAPDGIGRIGFLRLDDSNDKHGIDVEIKPERFRAFVSKVADDYVAKHPADWEVRA